jgi:hypothetical protein
MKKQSPIHERDLFSIQTVVGNTISQHKQNEIIDQLAIIFLKYFQSAYDSNNQTNHGDQLCQA